jgi:hypothetical protein
MTIYKGMHESPIVANQGGSDDLRPPVLLLRGKTMHKRPSGFRGWHLRAFACRWMRLVYWGGVISFALLPIGFAVELVGKLVHGVSLGEEDAIGSAFALLGIISATYTYREFLMKRAKSKK